MLSRLFALTSLFALAIAQNQCTSLGSLVHDNTGAPSGLAIPDCTYIQANSATICSNLATWDIINANTCYLKGPGYGCVIVNGLFSTQETFYCVVGPVATVTATATQTPSGSPLPFSTASASLSLTPSGSPSSSSFVTMTPANTPTAQPTATPSSIASRSATVSSTPTVSVTVSAAPSPSPLATPTPSSSVTVSAGATPTASPSPHVTVSSTGSPSTSTFSTSTASHSALATMTSTASFTPVPSTNISFIYTTTMESITKTAGGLAAISLAAIFGAFVVCATCAAAILRRQAPLTNEIKEMARRPSTVELARRSSVIEGRRASAVIIRGVESK